MTVNAYDPEFQDQTPINSGFWYFTVAGNWRIHQPASFTVLGGDWGKRIGEQIR